MNTLNNKNFKKEATAKELVALGIQEMPMLWGKFIPKKSISILCGGSDCGKSTLLKDLALSIAYEKDNFLGFKLNHETGNVLYVSTEEQEDQLSFVLGKQMNKYEKNDTALEKLAFLYHDGENPLSRIENKLQEKKHDLLIIDSFGDLMEGNSNSIVDVRKMLSRYSTLCHSYDVSILLLHHNTKNSEFVAPDKNRLNGSQAIEAKARAVLDFRKDQNPNYRYLTPVKGNLMEDSLKGKGIKLEFDSSTFTYSIMGNTCEWNSNNTSKSGKYDDPKLIRRFIELKRQGLSFAKVKEKLALEFKSAPSITWLKENHKILNDGISNDQVSEFESEPKNILECDSKLNNNEQ